MARLAGNTPFYRLELINLTTGEPSGIGVDLISVTSAIKDVMSGSFGPAGWWGFRVAAGALLENTDIYSAEVEDLYQKLKATGIHPNSIRDLAGDRGTQAHAWMESVGKGEGTFTWDGDEPVYYEEFGPGGGELDGWGKAGARWWRDYIESGVLEVVSAEEPLFSVRTLSAGTPDLVARTTLGGETEEVGVLEIVDWKTHKPASPMTMKRPDGTKVSTPARVEELIQLATYRGMYEEMHGEAVPRQRVVVFRENGTYLEDTRSVSPTLFFDLILPLWRGVAEVRG